MLHPKENVSYSIAHSILTNMPEQTVQTQNKDSVERIF